MLSQTKSKAIIGGVALSLFAALIASMSDPAEASLPGVNGRIVFHKPSDGGLWTVGPTGSSPIKIRDGFYLYDPAWSPDGNRIVYSADGRITWINSDGSGIRPLEEGSHPDWSPDGQWIYYVASAGQGPSIYKMLSDGTGVTPISTGFSSMPKHLSISPDGTKIAFAMFGPTGNDIYIMNTDGTDLQQLTTKVGNDLNSSNELHPDWAPDGSKLVFSVVGYFEVPDYQGLWLMNPDGSGISQIYQSQNSETWPAWSTDGSKIAFSTSSNEGNGLHTINPDGSALKRIYAGDNLFMPDWGACPPGTDCTNSASASPSPAPSASPSPAPSASPSPTPGASPSPTPSASPSPTPSASPSPSPLVTSPSVSLRFKKHLVAKGRVTILEGSTACYQNVEVKVQRKKSRKWRTLQRVISSLEGRFSVRLNDRPGRYRVVVPKHRPTEDFVCARSYSPTKRHRH